MGAKAARVWVAGFGLLVAGLSVGGAPWRSDLYGEDWAPPQQREGLHFLTDEMVQDFSYAGYHRGERPIPRIAGPVFNVVDYGADPTGVADSTNTIQATILAAEQAGGGVVYLPAGTYTLSKPADRNHAIQITRSGVVLRGAGWDKTFLVNTTTSMRSARVVRVIPASGANWGTAHGTPALVARDYPGPTQEVELASWPNFQAGEWIVLHNPFTDAVRPEGSFVQDLKMDGSISPTPNWLGQGGTLGGPMMYRQITAVDAEARKLWLDAPTRWYLLQRDGARVYRVDELLEEVGLEDFSIGNVRHPATEFMAENDYSNTARAAYEMHNSWLLGLERVRNGWVRDVRSFNPGNDNGVHMLSNGLVVDWSRGVTVERVEMQRAQYGGGGGNGYMIRLNGANEVLVRHSRVAYCRHGIVFWRMQNSGNVMYRNLDEFTGVQTGNTGTLQNTSGRASDHHGLFSHSNLFDRHVLNRSFVEAAFRGTSGTTPHAQSSSQSVFWNSEGKTYYTGRTYIVHSEQAGRGYVIGTQGAANGAISTPKIAGSDAFTTPVDRVEGVGMGASLEPVSLYEDQLRRRLAREGLTPPPAAARPIPAIEAAPGLQSLTLRLQSDFGRNYQLLQSPSLMPGSWAENGPALTGTGGPLEWSALAVPAEGPVFFRIDALP